MTLIPIKEFYNKKNIFITGGTGFLGKVLIEKLLRSLSNINNIYVLIRPKKGKILQERIDSILQDPLFDILKSQNPNVFNKIIPISGDCSELRLGLSETDYNNLILNANIIFHMAASVRFDDPLKKAILLNTRGTREIINLAEKIKNLSCFVYVSTTYCNCVVGKEIDEILYPAPGDWKKMIEIAEHFNPDELPLLSDKILGPYPNTYTFTKALSEHVVNDSCKKFPTIICRPSIVISTINEPLEGWCDNFNGPTGLLVSSGKGLIRCMYIEDDCYQDYIPVDNLVKALIAAAWHTSQKKDLTSVEILNCCSGKDFKSITIMNLIESCRKLSPEYPFNSILWLPKGSLSKCKIYSYICLIFFHLIPAFFIDGALKLMGRKAFITRLQTKIYIASFTLRYFIREWDFLDKNFMKLHNSLLEIDKEWGFDSRHTDVNLFMKNSILGARRYLLRESDEDLEQAKKNYKRMYWLDKITMAVLYSSFLYIVYYFNIHIILLNYISNKINYYISRDIV